MALALRRSERTAASRPARSNCSRTSSASISRRSPMAASSSSSSSSVTSMSSASTRARRARSTLTLCRAPARSSSRNSCSSRPVAPRNWPRLMPWRSSRWLRSWIRSRSSSSTSCSGMSSVTSSTRASAVFCCRAIWAWTTCRCRSRSVTSAVSSSAVANSDASDAHSSVTSGRTSSFTSLTSTRNETVWPSASSVESKVRMSPVLAPRSWSSSSGTTRPAPHLVEEVLGVEVAVVAVARSRSGRRAVDVDGHLVAVLGRTGHLDQLARRGPQAVDLGGDLLLGDLEARAG